MFYHKASISLVLLVAFLFFIFFLPFACSLSQQLIFIVDAQISMIQKSDGGII
jgi:hypothetical protein